MQYWGLTDPGCVRKQNQDAYQIEELDRNTLLCVVCDGMGGAKSGNIASSLAIDVFVEEIRRTWTPAMDQEKVDQMMLSAAKLANFTVFDLEQEYTVDPEEFVSQGRSTPFTGWKVSGRCLMTVANGAVAWSDGTLEKQNG